MRPTCSRKREAGVCVVDKLLEAVFVGRLGFSLCPRGVGSDRR